MSFRSEKSKNPSKVYLELSKNEDGLWSLTGENITARNELQFYNVHIYPYFFFGLHKIYE